MTNTMSPKIAPTTMSQIRWVCFRNPTNSVTGVDSPLALSGETVTGE